MKALVTGSAGFVGRHMVTELEQRGWDVYGVDPHHTQDTGRMRRGDAHRVFSGEWFAGHAFDLVVHCAYHVGGRAAIDGEPRLLARNLSLDANLFDWAVRSGQGRVLYFSSSAVYPIVRQMEGEQRSLAEDVIDFRSCMMSRPDARYGWAKLTGEHLAAAARESGLPVTVVRPFSGYGEDQDDTYPFRAFVERARRREDPFTIWGPGTQVRDWIHITDVVAGALAVAESGTTDPVNLCTGIGTSMLELAGMMCEAAGYRPTFEPQPDAPAGVAYRVGDPGRLLRYYRPQVTLAEGVEQAFITESSRA